MEEDLVQNRYYLFDFSVLDFLSDYGWYLLLITIILAYVYHKLQPTIDEYFKIKAEREYAANYHKDPDMAAARIAAQLSAVQRLQEKYNQEALTHQQKMEQKEAKKREEWLAQNRLPGEKLGTGSKKESLRSEYNPLMGDSGHSYRAQRKTPCSGGGCGKK